MAAGGAPDVGLMSTESSVPGYTAEEVSDLTSSVGVDEGLVQQQFKEEVDVNVIVRRFGFARDQAVETMGVYADFTGVYDYHSAVERIDGARDRFMKLPPELRDKFGNDPGRLISAAQNLSPEDFAKLVAPPEVVVVASPPKSGG